MNKKVLLSFFVVLASMIACTPGEDVTFKEDSASEITRDAAKTAVKAIDKAKALQTRETLKSAARAINIYFSEYMSFPDASDARGLHKVLSDAGYLTSADRLVDGWGNPLAYKRTSGGFILTSYGKDGQKGTGSDKWDADIVWDTNGLK